jgi:hypothetical protein
MSTYIVEWAMAYDGEDTTDVMRQVMADLDDVVNRWTGPTIFKVSETDPNDTRVTYNPTYVDVEVFRVILDPNTQ